MCLLELLRRHPGRETWTSIMTLGNPSHNSTDFSAEEVMGNQKSVFTSFGIHSKRIVWCSDIVILYHLSHCHDTAKITSLNWVLKNKIILKIYYSRTNVAIWTRNLTDLFILLIVYINITVTVILIQNHSYVVCDRLFSLLKGKHIFLETI